MKRGDFSREMFILKSKIILEYDMTAEERIGKLKDRAIESIKAGNQRIKQK